ncbi:FlgO family outer membrane protein [Neptunicella sp. SCSIO 80796]|uniref:FlgO family outer membrane protein n=1 Tax=Neptunicella plasticusilytica TaxID=3117012 RepID=UPI003A4E4F37
MNNRLSALTALLLLQGCQSLENFAHQLTDSDAKPDAEVYAETESPHSSPLTASNRFQQDYNGKFSNSHNALSSQVIPANLNINTYTSGIAQQLIGNLQYVNTTTPVAITSFVFLDSDYTQSSLLGNQLAEGLVHEMHKFGIPVIDFKATDYIRVTEQGDFNLSKDYTELAPDLPIKYVVAGTVVKHKDGYLVNARIIGLRSKAVVASAQSFLPRNIVDSLQKSSDESTRMSLVKG